MPLTNSAPLRRREKQKMKTSDYCRVEATSVIFRLNEVPHRSVFKFDIGQKFWLKVNKSQQTQRSQKSSTDFNRLKFDYRSKVLAQSQQKSTDSEVTKVFNRLQQTQSQDFGGH